MICSSSKFYFAVLTDNNFVTSCKYLVDFTNLKPLKQILCQTQTSACHHCSPEQPYPSFPGHYRLSTVFVL